MTQYIPHLCDDVVGFAAVVIRSITVLAIAHLACCHNVSYSKGGGNIINGNFKDYKPVAVGVTVVSLAIIARRSSFPC